MKNESTDTNNFLAWARNQPIEESQRNLILLQIMSKAVTEGIGDERMQEVAMDYCLRSKLPLNEGVKILQTHQKQNNVNPFSSVVHKPKAIKEINWIDEAKLFKDFFLLNSGGSELVYWNSDFYQLKDQRYLVIEENELMGKISQYIQSKSTILGDKRVTTIQVEILAALSGTCLLTKDLDPPFYVPKLFENPYGEEHQEKVNWITLKNGIVKIDQFLQKGQVELCPHDKNFFTFTQLPYEFDPNAVCPMFIKYLNEAVGDQEAIDFLQEWFGYNLTSHSQFQKFLLVMGPGGSGKSVLCKVLSLFIGEGNYVSIPLECFDSKRSFILAALEGMKSNIINDMNSFDKTSEGLLKQYVVGEPIIVERKYKNPYMMNSTAKITIATNVEPKFYDKSDGIWRRMVLLNFNNQILDEKKQNKNLMDDSWWQKSGELPGVFNWALEGLKRLENKGHFTIPSSVKGAVDELKFSLNSCALFLNNTVEKHEGGKCASSWLYYDYVKFCEANGHKHISTSSSFAKEVRRLFPDIKLGEKTHHVRHHSEEYKYAPAVKSKMWEGIRYIDFDQHEEDEKQKMIF